MTTTKLPLKTRVFEHTLAGLTTAAPINMFIVYVVSALMTDAMSIAILTTALATVVSAVRTFLVLRSQDRREHLAASAV